VLSGKAVHNNGAEKSPARRRSQYSSPTAPTDRTANIVVLHTASISDGPLSRLGTDAGVHRLNDALNHIDATCPTREIR
jgi:hypothetical protein